MKHNSVCCIYNTSLHYRWPIFKALSDNFDIDFCFGTDTVYSKSIKTFDPSRLPGYRRQLKNRRLFGKFYWQGGAVAMAFKPYKKYLLLGEAYCLSSWIIALLAKLLGKKTVCWTHGWYGRESRSKKIVSKWFYSLFDNILTYNEYAADLLAAGGISRKKIDIIGNSLDTAKHRLMRLQLRKTSVYSDRFGNDNPVLLYCGRIQKSKRLELLIEAASRLKSTHKNVNLVFVGKDDEQVDLETVAANHGILAETWFYGPCYDEEKLAELFYNATACVSPGNVGLTAVHSLSFGCPVITHDNLPFQGPEFESIRPGVTGDFFRQNDVDDLKRVIEKWLCRSDEEREAVAKAAFNEIDRMWNVDYQLSVFRCVL